MKKLKAGFFAIAVFAVSLANAPKVSAESYCGKLDYIVCGDSAVITGYENSPETLDIPAVIDEKKVRAVRENAFYKCDSLKSVTIPDTVTSIGHHAFSGCTSLTTANIKGTVNNIEEGCFSGCLSLREVILPDTVKEIGKNSFYKCREIKGIQLPSNLETIGENAFSGCLSLEDISLPNSTLRIGGKAFFDCPKLLCVNIPDSAAELGSCSFGYSEGTCRKVADLTITGSSESLGKAYAADNGFAFIDTDNVRRVNIPYVPIAVMIFSGAGLMLLFIPGKLRYFRLRYEYEN